MEEMDREREKQSGQSFSDSSGGFPGIAADFAACTWT
jgi:hypothetical protein